VIFLVTLKLHFDPKITPVAQLKSALDRRIPTVSAKYGIPMFCVYHLFSDMFRTWLRFFRRVEVVNRRFDDNLIVFFSSWQVVPGRGKVLFVRGASLWCIDRFDV